MSKAGKLSVDNDHKNKCLRNDKMNDLFPKIQKEQENYEVENAHTTRLLNSQVVYSRRLLNKHKLK